MPSDLPPENGITSLQLIFPLLHHIYLSSVMFHVFLLVVILLSVARVSTIAFLFLFLIQFIVMMKCLQNLRVLKVVGDERKMEWGKNVIQSGFEGWF